MIRFLLFVGFTAVLVLIAVLLATDQGITVIEWLSLHIELRTSLALVLLLGFLFVFWLVIRLVGGVVRLPGLFGQTLSERRLKLAGTALGDGFAAIRGGDVSYATDMLKDAERAFPDSVGLMLLRADVALAKGDTDKARDLYRTVAESGRFTAAGRRGLIDVAQALGDDDEMLMLSREAVDSGLSARWATGPLFQILARRRRWEDALSVLGRSARAMKADDPNRPVRAALLAAMARDAADAGRTGEALRLAQQALSMDPGLTEATLVAAGAFIAEGKPRKAIPVLTAGWKRHPHPDIARLYLAAEPNQDPLRRLQRIETLIENNPTHPESRMALAEASLEAKLWGQARHILDPMVRGTKDPSPVVCRLVALLEEGENRDLALANQWLMLALKTRPTEGWHCTRCGSRHGRWEPTCPACGSLGTVIWDTLPVTDPDGRGLPAPAASDGDKTATAP